MRDGRSSMDKRTACLVMVVLMVIPLVHAESTTTTDAPLTSAAPTTVNTTDAPTTVNTTDAPTTVNTTDAPTTVNTTAAPTTVNTTAAPTTVNTTDAPTTVNTTAAPTTVNTTAAPTTVNTTAAPTTVNTIAAPTTVNTTDAPTTVNTTDAPTTVNTTDAPTTVNTTDAPTTVNTTDAPQPTAVPTTSTAPGVQQQVYISEIQMDKDGGFKTIEIQISEKAKIGRYAMVMVDGGTNKSMSIKYLKDIVQHSGHLLTVNFNSSDKVSVQSAGTGIALYYSTTIMNVDWTLNEGLVDALVIGTTYDDVSQHLLTTLTPGGSPFVLNPSIYGMNRTISRCSFDHMRSTETYALINPSLGDSNNKTCEERSGFQNQMSMKFSAGCEVLKSKNTVNKKLVQELLTFVVHKVNKYCKCGVTMMHVQGDPCAQGQDPTIECCGGTSLNMKFVAPNKEQDDKLMASYKMFIKNTPNITLDGKTYPLTNSCYNDCCAKPAPQTDDKKKNVQITVGVVLGCLFVFIVIVICVILFLRRKKSAVYQFRMSRLQEDDDDLLDYQSTDTFVGGQDATFDLKR